MQRRFLPATIVLLFVPLAAGAYNTPIEFGIEGVARSADVTGAFATVRERNSEGDDCPGYEHRLRFACDTFHWVVLDDGWPVVKKSVRGDVRYPAPGPLDVRLQTIEGTTQWVTPWGRDAGLREPTPTDEPKQDTCRFICGGATWFAHGLVATTWHEGPDDTNGFPDLYIFDDKPVWLTEKLGSHGRSLLIGYAHPESEVVSFTTLANGAFDEDSNACDGRSMEEDGGYSIFTAPGEGCADVVMWDAGKLQLLSQRNGRSGNDASYGAITYNRTRVAFQTYATDLAPGTDRPGVDVLFHDGASLRNVSPEGVEGEVLLDGFDARGEKILMRAKPIGCDCGYQIYLYDIEARTHERLPVAGLMMLEGGAWDAEFFGEYLMVESFDGRLPGHPGDGDRYAFLFADDSPAPSSESALGDEGVEAPGPGIIWVFALLCSAASRRSRTGSCARTQGSPSRCSVTCASTLRRT